MNEFTKAFIKSSDRVELVVSQRGQAAWADLLLILCILLRRMRSNNIENLVRPHVLNKSLELGYKQMAEDEERENEALEWSEATMVDVSDEPRHLMSIYCLSKT